MLSVAGEYLADHNPKARLVMYGQELNPESYAPLPALVNSSEIERLAPPKSIP